jgi:hypothetical protein
MSHKAIFYDCSTGTFDFLSSQKGLIARHNSDYKAFWMHRLHRTLRGGIAPKSGLKKL